MGGNLKVPGMGDEPNPLPETSVPIAIAPPDSASYPITAGTPDPITTQVILSNGNRNGRRDGSDRPHQEERRNKDRDRGRASWASETLVAFQKREKEVLFQRELVDVSTTTFIDPQTNAPAPPRGSRWRRDRGWRDGSWSVGSESDDSGILRKGN